MAKRSAILLFIPGNPGLSSYYTQFFASLKQKIPTLDIISSNHLGFNATDGRREPSAIDLDAQIAHKIDLLDGILLGRRPDEKDIPIFVAGHSVGAYIATKVLEARPRDIKKVYLLFPTLSHIAKSPQGKIAKTVLSVPGVIQFLSLLTWSIAFLVPENARLELVKKFTGHPTQAARVSAFEVLTRNTVYSALTLAYSEMMEINDPDPLFWEKYGDRCCAYWARSDHWVDAGSRLEILDMAKGMENYVCDESPHAFCVSHNELVGAHVGKWMARDIEAQNCT